MGEEEVPVRRASPVSDLWLRVASLSPRGWAGGPSPERVVRVGSSSIGVTPAPARPQSFRASAPAGVRWQRFVHRASRPWRDSCLVVPPLRSGAVPQRPQDGGPSPHASVRAPENDDSC